MRNLFRFFTLFRGRSSDGMFDPVDPTATKEIETEYGTVTLKIDGEYRADAVIVGGISDSRHRVAQRGANQYGLNLTVYRAVSPREK